MANKNSQSSIAKQAAILAVASIIVRAIGLLYRIPLSHIIGDLGNSYYGIAFNIYTILLLISGYSIPVAVSKLSSEYLALKQYRNARQVVQSALLFVGVVGGLMMVILLIFAPAMLPEGAEGAVHALRVLAPTLFISGFIGVFQGMFQARRTTAPTAVAQVLEQILNAVTSIFFAYFLTRGVIGDEVATAELGALGATLGTLCGVCVSITVLYLIYRMNGNYFAKEIARDRSKSTVPLKRILRNTIFMLLPVVLSTLVTNLAAIADQYIYYGIMSYRGVDPVQTGIEYGILVGKVIPIANVPSALAYTVSIALLPVISAAYVRKDREKIFYHLNESIGLSALISMPSAVGLFILSGPIMDLLFSGTPRFGSISLMLASINIVINCYNAVMAGALQGIGKAFHAMMAGVWSLLANVIVVTLLLLFTDLGGYAIPVSQMISFLVLCLINYRYFRRFTGYRQAFRQPLLMPALASLIMGAGTFLMYQIFLFILRFNILALLLTIPLSIVLYLFLVVRLNIFDAEGIAKLPGGKHLIRLMRLLHL